MPRILVWVLVAVLALALQVSSIPTATSSQSGSAPGNPSRPDTSAIDAILHRLPPGSQVIHDPTGYYEYIYFGPREFTLNISGFSKMKVDPYSHLFGNATIVGNVVHITVPASKINNLQVYSPNWGGVGGGFCQSFSGTNSSVCNNPSDSINENVADSYDSVSWSQACVPSSATNCETSFWSGMSQTDTHSGYLVQNGFQASWTSGNPLGFLAWYEIACPSHCEFAQNFAQQPTSWQNYEYTMITKVLDANCPGTQCTHTAYFYDYIGVGGSVYSASTTEASPAVQASFVQGEGIMETPSVMGLATFCALVAWSPNPLTMRGYYIGSLGNIYYYGTGPSNWQAKLRPDSSCNPHPIIAYGTQASGVSTYTITHA
jgi:hypothetical protein